MSEFSDKHVCVFGGTSGINLGIARGFARAGAKLSVFSRSQDKVDAAVAELGALGPAAHGASADVRDPEAVQAALAGAVAAHGPIDVLVSGAAGNFPAPALGMSANAFGSVIGIDLNGTFHVLRFAFEHLRKPGAAVINISAPQAWVPMAFQAHVCAAKAGVDMLTRTLAMEWGPAGVRVNSLVPGPIAETEGMRRLLADPSKADQLAKTVPLQRLGTVDDCADVALFLASEAARYVSGAVLPVDGGWSLGGAQIAMSKVMAGG
ncbi:SDR family oxidoreductase [Pseudenhygromyxa sp. WMMC2535]|uniref:SDR family oxidoreductase n=1 Tax=Pseudenhygromyxa sp. WMMC2535 TaxID=2712867 RepID=UPI001552CDD0|nr:SDR family oxidoreductase [Pseudenhygromyxa sp. WMMC2535]NVB36252.1 SDR family oxidoreductase [Pseudenhygromyxa sp. WMMC2535]